VVYVNGKELKREHIEAGRRWRRARGGGAGTDGVGGAIKELREGVNVIGLEIVRGRIGVTEERRRSGCIRRRRASS